MAIPGPGPRLGTSTLGNCIGRARNRRSRGQPSCRIGSVARRRRPADLRRPLCVPARCMIQLFPGCRPLLPARPSRRRTPGRRWERSKLLPDGWRGDAKPPTGNPGSDGHRSRGERAALKEPHAGRRRGGAPHHRDRRSVRRDRRRRADRSPLAGQAQLGADNTASSGWKARPPAALCLSMLPRAGGCWQASDDHHPFGLRRIRGLQRPRQCRPDRRGCAPGSTGNSITRRSRGSAWGRGTRVRRASGR